jgi:carbon monoxide dehydrogenase subunit G
MELDHEFTVPVPVDRAWQVLLDVERIAPCMPGATLDAADGDEFTGRLKVRLGAMTVTYRGTARIASRDEEAHAVTIEASGKEARGPGTASATVQAKLYEDDGRTRVTVHTKLNVTGRPAQFGRGILAEVGGRLVGRFADNLAAELATGETATDTAGQAEPGVGAPAEARVETAASSAATVEEAVADGDGAQEASADRHTAAPKDRDTAGAPAGSGVPSDSSAAPAVDAGPTATPAAERRTPARRPEAEPIDLLKVAGPSVAKRVVPVVAVLAVLSIIWRLIRRRG